MISQIFQYLTKKQVNDSLTLMPDRSPQEMFVSQSNISKIAVYMYNSMNIANKPDYMKFRDRIQHHMEDWIWKQKLPADDADNSYKLYVMKRLNNNFVKQHGYLIERSNVTYTNMPVVQNMNMAIQMNTNQEYGQQYDINPESNNVYHNKFKIVTRNENGDIIQTFKKGAEMMPWDYQNFDVWKKQETYADFDFEKWRSFRDGYGYAGIYIPRNVDRDPESFGLTHRDPERASLADVPRAYDNSEYFKAKGIKCTAQKLNLFNPNN